MLPQRHIIRRQTIELVVPDEQSAAELQRRVSEIYQQRLIPLIEEFFNRHSTADSLLRIDTLELDLREISAESLEDQLITELSRVLSLALAQEIERQERARTDGNISLRALSQLELVALFTQTGNLPWWVDRSQPRLVERALERLIVEAPAAFVDLVRELARDPGHLARLVEHAADQTLAELFALLDPAIAAACPGLPTDLLAVFDQVELLGLTARSQRRAVVWSAVVFIASQGSSAGRVVLDVARDLFLIAAARLNVEYRALLSSADRTLNADAPREASTQRGSRGLPGGLLLGDPSAAAAQPELRPSSLAALVSALHREARGEPSGVRETPLRVPNAKPSQRTRPDLGFSDADTISIDNAGLVLLWRFVGHFFAHLGLVAEKQLIDEAARQRAVGLLGYLAAWDPEPVEYLLPLCKVLCGLDPSALFEFGPPVTAEEADECARLLTAVIEQAPILKNMSPEGLRGTFLLRPGLLSARDGAWLLRVESATYDVVLERFPWTWDWVKLPWMEAPLRVEW